MPVAAVVTALVAGIFIPRLDQHVDAVLPAGITSVLFGGDPDAARTVLSAISSSLVNVTSLTFSLTVVTLQLASSQFSPRLLRTFTSDVFVQATLGLFLATFTYSLTVLRVVRNGSEPDQFVPRIAVTVAFVLAVASTIGLVLFLAHLARQIRVETMLREVHQDASATISGVLEEGPQNAAQLPTPPEDSVRLSAPGSGFVVSFDERRLLAAACRAHAVVMLDCHPGSSLVNGTPVGTAWALAGALPDEATAALRAALTDGIGIGYERTAAQDVGYGLRQLTDVTNKALSPGINDPTTAVHALGHIASLLCDLADRDTGPRVLRDDDGRARVWLRRPDLAELVDTAITQPRRYGSSDPQVMARLYLLLEQFAWRARREQLPIVTAQLARLQATVDGSDFDATERGQLADAARRVRIAVADGAGVSRRRASP